MSLVSHLLICFGVLTICVSVCHNFNFLGTFSKEKLFDIAACIAETRDHKAMDELYYDCYTKKLPLYMLLVLNYCIKQMVPDMKDVYDAFDAGRRNKTLISLVHNCWFNNVPCITGKDKCKLKRFKKCNNDISEKYCVNDH